MKTIINPIAKGKGWTSLNDLYVERSLSLESDLKKYNTYRKEIGLNSVTLDDYVKIKHRCTLWEYLTKPLTKEQRKKRYLKSGRYLNNKPLKT